MMAVLLSLITTIAIHTWMMLDIKMRNMVIYVKQSY